MTTHFTPGEAERWVAGVLDEPAAAALEAHARGCLACEALLKAEARADARLTQLVAQVPAFGERRRRLGSRLLTFSVPLAAAAALVLLVAQQWVSSSNEALRTDGGSEAALVQVPRYERGAQVPSEALTANEPFPL
jgi:hypothetical protein